MELFSFNHFRKILFIGLITFQGFNLAETTAQVAETTVAETSFSNDQLDNLLTAAQQQTNQIYTLLHDISLVTSNNESLSKEERLTVIKAVRDIQGKLSSFKSQAFTKANIKLIYATLILNKELCDYLSKGLSCNFNEMEPFAFERILTRGIQTLTSPDQLKYILQANDLSVAKLTRSAESIGLTWYNKAYRVVDNWVIQPWQRYDITHYSTILLGGAALTLGAWWYFTDRGIPLKQEIKAQVTPETVSPVISQTPSFYEPVPVIELKQYIYNETGTKLERWLREKMGPRVLYSESKLETGGTALTVSNKDQLKLPGLIQEKAVALSAFGSFVYAYGWPKVKNDYTSAKNALSKKIVSLHNNLKGGNFKGHTIKTADTDWFKIPLYSFDDVVGEKNAKNILSDVADYLVSPEKFDLAKTTPEKGYLLTGPARTGKSFMAEAFAGEVRKRLQAAGKNPDSVHFLPVDVGTIKYFGGIKGYLEFAKKHTPCILFIDEIDLVGLQRAGGDSAVLADFLVALSDFALQDSDKQVIILAATNRSENIDDAIKRRGRLGIEIRFTYPSAEYRKDFFMRKLESLGIPTTNIDLDGLAEQTIGKSYNDLDSVLKKAILAAKSGSRQLDQDLLEQAVDSELFLILSPEDHPLSETERSLVAVSVAGEAFVSFMFDSGVLPVRATINPFLPKLQEKSPWESFFKEDDNKQDLIKYGKVFTTPVYEFLSETYTSEQLKNSCKRLLAGRCAQQIIFGETIHNKETALTMQKCFAIAREIVSNGLDGKYLSDAKRDTLSDKAYDLIEELEKEVLAFLTEKKDKLELLASKLLKYDTLSSLEIAYTLDDEFAKKIDALNSKTTGSTITQYPEVKEKTVAANA